MNRLLVSLIFSTSIALFLTVVSSTGSPEVLVGNWTQNTDWLSPNSPSYSPKSYSRTFTWGFMYPANRLLYGRIMARSKNPLGGIVFEEADFPGVGEKFKGTISCIRIRDHIPDGKGGCASIDSGGVGFRSVKMHFESQMNGGYLFFVLIYGH